MAWWSGGKKKRRVSREGGIVVVEMVAAAEVLQGKEDSCGIEVKGQAWSRLTSDDR